MKRNAFEMALQSAVLVAIASSMVVSTEVAAKVTKTITTDGTLTMDIEVEGTKAEEHLGGWGTPYNEIRLLGVEGMEAIIYNVGEPALPAIRFYVDTNSSIAILPGTDIEELPVLETQVVPNQFSFSKNQLVRPPFAFNAAAYESAEYTPSESFKVEDAGTIHGVKHQLVTLYPYYYKPATGEQQLRKSFKVIARNVAPASDFTGKETLVFVAGQKFANSPALKKYLSFKRQQGFWTYLEVVSADGLSTPEKIRARLRSYYQSKNHDLRHVVLVGDITDVPAFESKHLGYSDFDEEAMESTKLPTDHYYRVLDTESADADINGPDVGLGRISATDEKQLVQILDRYTKYQRGQFADQSWLSRASFVGTDDFTFYSVAEATHDFVISNLTKLLFNGIFPTAPNPGGDQLYATRHSAEKSHLIEAFSQGRGVIEYSGHGGTDKWAGPDFDIKDLDQIAHTEAQPFVISNACITAQFSEEASFAEAWQRHPRGSIFFLGSVDSSYWYEDDRYEKLMFQQIVAGKNLQFGDLANAASAEVFRYYGGENRSLYYWETYTGFGDPSIQLRTKPTQAIVVHAPQGIPKNSGGVGVLVTDKANNPVAGVKVLVELPNGKRLQATSPSNGQALFAFDSRTLTNAQSLNVYANGINMESTATTIRVGN